MAQLKFDPTIQSHDSYSRPPEQSKQVATSEHDESTLIGITGPNTDLFEIQSPSQTDLIHGTNSLTPDNACSSNTINTLPQRDKDIRDFVQSPEFTRCPVLYKMRIIERLLTGITVTKDAQAILTVITSLEPDQFDLLVTTLYNSQKFHKLFTKCGRGISNQIISLCSHNIQEPQNITLFIKSLLYRGLHNTEKTAVLECLQYAAERGTAQAVHQEITNLGLANQLLTHFNRDEQLNQLLVQPYMQNSTTPIFNNRIVGPLDICNASELAFVNENEGLGILLPYMDFDPCAEPVIIIHGIYGQPEDEKQLIDHYAQQPGKQLYLFYYNDATRFIDRLGEDFACELLALKQEYLDPSVDTISIIGHSMGGLVAKCGINSLINPDWFYFDESSNRKVYGADQPSQRLTQATITEFSDIRLVTIDSPFHGYSSPANMRNIIGSVYESPLWDFSARSALLENIFAVSMPSQVTIDSIEANDFAAGSMYHGTSQAFLELNNRNTQRVLDYMLGNTNALNHKPKLQNFMNLLEHNKDYTYIKNLVEQEQTQGTLDLERFKEIITIAIASIPGHHTSFLNDPAMIYEVRRSLNH